MVGRVLVAALLTAGLLAAQRGGGGGGSRGGGDMPMGMQRPQQTNKLTQMADKLKLSKEQTAQVADILQAAAVSAAPLSQKIAEGRRSMANDMITGQDKGDDYTKRLADFTAALGQMDALEAATYAKIYALLKPNQQKNAELVFEEQMAGIFIRTASGSPGGGRRRGQ